MNILLRMHTQPPVAPLRRINLRVTTVNPWDFKTSRTGGARPQEVVIPGEVDPQHLVRQGCDL